MNPEEIIDKNKQSLVEKIDVKNTLLWERLIELGLFNSGDVEQIVNENPSNRGQTRQILNTVRRGGIPSYQLLRQALTDTKQGGVVDRYLPEIDPQPESQKKVTDSIPSGLRIALASHYLSRYKKIILWGSGINPAAEKFDSLYTDMQYVRIRRAASDQEGQSLDHYTNMLGNFDTKKILIWGEAGVGKTTFCSKFCQDWALIVKEKEGKRQELTEEQKSELEKLTKEQRSKLNNIGLLIYIVLRDIDKGTKPVKDIILSHLVKEGSIWSKPGLRDHLTGILENSSEHANFLLLFDGFDEMSDSDGNIVQVEEVITGRTYDNINCIATCRPYASHGIVLNVDVEIRLKGFSEAQAKSFVEMYARIKYTDRKAIMEFVSRTMSQIESSAELLEMSTNPSMLQLLCLLSWKKVKIGTDRTSVFKYYTRYLLMQYHIKLGKKEKLYSDDLYHQNLLDAGRVALMGLKQNHFQLVFSNSEAHQICGDAIFDIGFLTELPSTDAESTKIQFMHKMLQEYLAAYYVVNNPSHEGLQLLMEFCSTSQTLMGSQIILEFVSNMSTRMGKEIQKKIRNYVSTWDSDEKVDPKSRTSFLISMLKGNKQLKFSLPVVVDIDLREYDFVSDRIRKFLKILFHQKSPLERFFDMDGHGVKKISLTLGQYNRLNVLQNTKINSLEELIINGCKTWSKEDNEYLCVALNQMKPGLLCITNSKTTLMEKDTISFILQHIHTLILENCGFKNEHLLSILRTEHHLNILRVNEYGVRIDNEVIGAVMELSSDIKLDISGKEITLIHKTANRKSLSICNSGLEIDASIAEAVSRFADHTQLDLSGNQVTEKCACITLIHKAATMKTLSVCNCGIEIDTEIAEAVSRLPGDIQLDLSGNKLKKMDPKLLSGVLLHMPEDKKIDMTGWGITIDVDIVRALSKMPQLKSLNASHIRLTPEAAREFSLSKLQQLVLSRCDINYTVCVTLMISLSAYCPQLKELDLSNNKLTSTEWCHYVQMKQLKKLYLFDCGINDTVCVSLMISLSQHCPLFEVLTLRGNNLTSDEWCHHVQMKKLRELNISNCGISDSVCVSLMISLSKLCPLLEVLDLTYSKLSSSGVWKLVDLLKQMKNLKKLKLYNNPCMLEQNFKEKIKKALEKSNPGLII